MAPGPAQGAQCLIRIKRVFGDEMQVFAKPVANVEFDARRGIHCRRMPGRSRHARCTPPRRGITMPTFSNDRSAGACMSIPFGDRAAFGLSPLSVHAAATRLRACMAKLVQAIDDGDDRGKRGREEQSGIAEPVEPERARHAATEKARDHQEA